MRRVPSGLRYAICIVSLTLLSIPALQPLLNSDFTCGYDNILHLWRAVETDALLQRGIVYSRWQPHMALGFGFPVLLFNPPISPLLAAFFHRLGLVWPAAVNATFATGVLLSAWTMWLLVRDWWGDMAGVVAGVIIISLPFHAYVNFHRASMSEALAWAFPPLVLWGLIRWQKHGQRRGLLAAVCGQAALLLTHDASAYLFLPFSVATVAALALAHRSRAMLWRGALALALGVGLAAFFWMPSVLERPYVQFERVLDYPYAASFVALDYLLEPPRVADPTLINPWLPKGIGLFTALTVLPVVFTWLRAEREQRFWLAGVGIVTAGYIFLTLPYARPIWRQVSVLQYLHFPWRFLTPATVGVATLGGAAVHPVSRITSHVSRFSPLASRFCLPAILVALILGSLGWLYPPHCALPQPASLPGMLAYERSTGELGGTFFSELLPIWVRQMPTAAPLEEELNGAREPVRLQPETLPEGAHVLRADYGPLAATLELESPVPFRARYLAFYYPGWRVTVDGATVPIAPTDPDGLIGFDVPAGRHTIDVRFGETSLRLVADGLSLLSLVALVALISRPSSLFRHAAHRASRFTPRVPYTNASYVLLLLTSAALVVTKLALIDRIDNLLRRANLVGDRLLTVDTSTQVTFGDEFVLLGYDDLPESVPSDEEFEIKTYWRALQPGGPDYGVTVNVVDGQGYRWQSSDEELPRWHRPPPSVGEWQPDQYATVALSVSCLPGTPPGTYTVEVVAFDRDTLAPLTAHDADGRALGPGLVLGQIAVTVPHRPPTLDALGIHHHVDTALGPLTLLGADFDRHQAAPGDPLLLTTFWRADPAPTQPAPSTIEVNLTAHLTLLASDGSPAAEYLLPPSAPGHPTSAWQPGDVWRGQHLLHLPPHLQDGDHAWRLAVEPGGQATRLPTTLHVTAPARTFSPPAVEVGVDTRLGDVATLVGADVRPEASDLQAGTPITVTLVWRAEGETSTSYHVFLHLLDPQGRLVAQSDTVPAGWSRPTTGWLAGEYVTDVHVLTLPSDVPAGDYTLSAGLYVPGGERLITRDGSSAISITTITAEAR